MNTGKFSENDKELNLSTDSASLIIFEEAAVLKSDCLNLTQQEPDSCGLLKAQMKRALHFHTEV